MNREVDARNLPCPMPVVQTKKAAEEMTEDGILTVLVDNEIAVQNLQKFANQKGYESSAEKKSEMEYVVTISVKVSGIASEASEASEAAGNAAEIAGEADQNAEEQEMECRTDSRRRGMTIVLSANTMGTGDEKLGKALMKAFVFAVTRQDVLPETILCYNTGAYLTCEGSDSLEDFKSLEAEGVNILTCGTCLDFYGIKEKLAVGTVTNMYEIVEKMEAAKTIVRP